MEEVSDGEANRPPLSRSRGVANRLAQYAWFGLLTVIAMALIGSLVYAATWQPGGDQAPQVTECESPPCFSPNGMPAGRDLLVVIPTLGYLFVIALAAPSLLVGTWDLLRGDRLRAGRRYLLFFGPVLVFVGMEIVPHLLNPCLVMAESDVNGAICEATAHDPRFADIKDRWHGLHHTLVGALPMTALYGAARRRWGTSALSSAPER